MLDSSSLTLSVCQGPELLREKHLLVAADGKDVETVKLRVRNPKQEAERCLPAVPGIPQPEPTCTQIIKTTCSLPSSRSWTI